MGKYRKSNAGLPRKLKSFNSLEDKETLAAEKLMREQTLALIAALSIVYPERMVWK